MRESIGDLSGGERLVCFKTDTEFGRRIEQSLGIREDRAELVAGLERVARPSTPGWDKLPSTTSAARQAELTAKARSLAAIICWQIAALRRHIASGSAAFSSGGSALNTLCQRFSNAHRVQRMDHKQAIWRIVVRNQRTLPRHDLVSRRSKRRAT